MFPLYNKNNSDDDDDDDEEDDDEDDDDGNSPVSNSPWPLNKNTDSAVVQG